MATQLQQLELKTLQLQVSNYGNYQQLRLELQQRREQQ